MRTQTFDLDAAPLRLLVHNGLGAVDVAAGDDRDHATVELDSPDLTGTELEDFLDDVLVELRDGALSVVSPQPERLLGRLRSVFGGTPRLDVRVAIPAGTPSSLVVAAGTLTTRGVLGPSEVVSGSGGCSVETVDGELELRSGSGTVDLGDVTGDTTLRVGSGSCRLGEVGGRLYATSGSGSLTVRRANGEVDTRCGSGEVRFEHLSADLRHTSGSGDLQIGLPAGVDVELDVRTGSGEVQTGLLVADTPGTADRSITVHVRTGSGDVRLVRAAQAPA